MTDRSEDDLPFEVMQEGSGEPLILIHGSSSDRRTWDDVRVRLAEHFTVVSYSRRFHWPNPSPEDSDDYSMMQQVDDLLDLIDRIGGGPVHLLGHSYGGYLALLAAKRRPEQIRAMVLIEPPVVPLFISDPPRPAELLRLASQNPRLALALVKFGARGIGPARKAAQRNDLSRAIETLGKAILGSKAFGDLTPERWQQINANNIRAEYLGSGFAPITADEVASIATPTLIMTATDSPAIWGLIAAELQALLPNAELVKIPNASHIVHEDNPEGFRHAAIRFLRDHPSSS